MPCECLVLTRVLMFVDRRGDTPLHTLMENRRLTPQLVTLVSDIVLKDAWTLTTE